jgi:hypothetical protein
MVAESKRPGGTGTRRGAENLIQSPRIIHNRRDCANCGTLLYPREFRYCRPCRRYLALWRALLEMSRIIGGVS